MNTKLSFAYCLVLWDSSLVTGCCCCYSPAYDLGSTDIFSKEGNLTDYIDRLFRPGILFGSEGILSTIPTIGTALLGMFTGEFILSEYLNDKPLRKVLYLVLAAITLNDNRKDMEYCFPDQQTPLVKLIRMLGWWTEPSSILHLLPGH